MGVRLPPPPPPKAEMSSSKKHKKKKSMEAEDQTDAEARLSETLPATPKRKSMFSKTPAADSRTVYVNDPGANAAFKFKVSLIQSFSQAIIVQHYVPTSSVDCNLQKSRCHVAKHPQLLVRSLMCIWKSHSCTCAVQLSSYYMTGIACILDCYCLLMPESRVWSEAIYVLPCCHIYFQVICLD